MLNKIFHLERFVVVYLDDIVVAAGWKTKKRLGVVRLRVLRENELYVNKEKSAFA